MKVGELAEMFLLVREGVLICCEVIRTLRTIKVKLCTIMYLNPTSITVIMVPRYLESESGELFDDRSPESAVSTQ